MAVLTETQRAVLDFERTDGHGAGLTASAIRAQLGWSQARYYQVLNALMDSPEAIAVDPLLVYRLRRLREKQLAARG